MQEALAREGLTLAELRANIERGVLRRIVMQRDVQPKIEASDADVRAEYERVKATEFTKPATVTLQEILIPEDKGGLAVATELAGRARAGEDFGALARSYSTAPSRSNGGDLGQLAQGDLNPDLEKLAFGLAVGTVSEPLPVAGGYRLIRVVAKTTGSTTPFDAVKDRVRDRVMMTRFDKAYDEFVAELRKTASVELRVREVPLQLTGPIPEGSLREALEPLSPGYEEPAPAPRAGAAHRLPRRPPRPRPGRRSPRSSTTKSRRRPRPPRNGSRRRRARPRPRPRPRASRRRASPRRGDDGASRQASSSASTRSCAGSLAARWRPTARSRCSSACRAGPAPWAGRCAGSAPARPASPGTASWATAAASRSTAARRESCSAGGYARKASAS